MIQLKSVLLLYIRKYKLCLFELSFYRMVMQNEELLGLGNIMFDFQPVKKMKYVFEFCETFMKQSSNMGQVTATGLFILRYK